MNNMVPLHSDCVMCRTEQDSLKPAEAVLVILLMLSLHTPDEIVKELCFAHRRGYEDKLKSFEADYVS